MPTFIFFIAICLLVVASILLETDASPKPNKKLEKGPSSSGNAESTPGPTPENPWAARHEDLTLIEPDGLIVQNNGKNSGCRSVRAKLSIPKSDIFYYEVKILKKVKGKGAIYIGLATKETPLDECVGQSVGTYAYGSAMDGLLSLESPNLALATSSAAAWIWQSAKSFTQKTENVWKRPVCLSPNSAADLYPCISLYNSGTKIEANFGPNFKFDIAEGT
uniref:B30.2/SPRY domain-containing protein n=1 Tax=Globodera pallida TaxID=36090 RepID=A0A183CHV9_GLOPA